MSCYNVKLPVLAVSSVPVYLHSRELDFEGESIGVSDLYDWSGMKFEPRETQQKRLTKREAPAATAAAAASGLTAQRHDEPGLGMFVIVENERVLDEYLQGTTRSPFRSPRDNYIIVVRYVADADTFRERIDNITRRLWTRYGLEVVTVMSPCRNVADNENIAAYYPFDIRPNGTMVMSAGGNVGDQQQQLQQLEADDFGVCTWQRIDDVDYNMRLVRRLSNMNGYPFRVSIFDRYPTALRTTDMPRVIARSYYNKATAYSGGFGGFDGLVLGHIAQKLNFRTVVVTPIGSDFGYVDNGTFYGE